MICVGFWTAELKILQNMNHLIQTSCYKNKPAVFFLEESELQAYLFFAVLLFLQSHCQGNTLLLHIYSKHFNFYDVTDADYLQRVFDIFLVCKL